MTQLRSVVAAQTNDATERANVHRTEMNAIISQVQAKDAHVEELLSLKDQVPPHPPSCVFEFSAWLGRVCVCVCVYL